MEIRDKVVLVTGGARRIGREIALSVAQRGAKVAIHYRRSSKEAKALATEIKLKFGTSAAVFKADLFKVSEARKLAKNVLGHFGQVDILINNASIYEKTVMNSIRESDWDRNLNVHVKSPFFLSQAVAPGMQKNGGKIINIADWTAHRIEKNYIPYGVSKAALIALTQVLAKNLAPQVQVNAVLPGPIILPEQWGEKTRKKVIEATPLKRIGSPRDVAQAVLFLIEGSDFMTGSNITVDGGQSFN